MRVLAIDLGRKVGYGLLAGKVLSGSHVLFKKWSPFGECLIVLENHLQKLIDKYEPDVLGVARPFTRHGDTPMNLLPMYGGFAILNRVAALNKLRLEIIQESDARSAFLGKGNMPRGSVALKLAVHKACRARGWVCVDEEASDALCIAAAVLERLSPAQAHQTTPLFVASPKRRRKAE